MPDGRPASNVKVSITSTDSNPLSLTTGGDGGFQTGDISAGNYTVSVKVEGFQQESELVTIDRDAPTGHTQSVVIYLRMPGQKKGDIYSANPLFKDVPKPAIEKFKKGADKMHANDAKAAIPFFESAVAEYPTFAVAYYELGDAYLKDNQLDKALESFVKAIQAKPDYTEAKYSVGYVHYLKKEYEVAAAIFDDVVKIKSDMAEAEMYRGISLYYLKNVDAAEISLKRTVGMPAGDKLPFAHLYLGQIYITKKKNAEAAAELEKYLVLVPKAPNAEKLRTTIADLKKAS